MSDAHSLHFSLLRPAILHILRASGFHSTKPSVLDTLTDLCARHLLLSAQRTADFVYDRTSNDEPSNLPNLQGSFPADESQNGDTVLIREDNEDATEPERDTGSDADLAPEPQAQTRLDAHAPTLSDVRQALESIYFFTPTLTSGEESWKEVLRRPLTSYAAGAARDKERRRRDLEDTRDVREFIDWCTGPQNREIRRIANMLSEEHRNLGGLDNLSGANASSAAAAATATTASNGVQVAGKDGDSAAPHLRGEEIDAPANLQRGLVDGMLGVVRTAKDDYVTVLKKKHSKTGDGARYAGTALGKLSEERPVLRIEGGPESLEAWAANLKRKRDEGERSDGD